MFYRIRRFFPIIWRNLIPRLTRFTADTVVIEDAGCRRTAGRYCAEAGFERALIVTDRNLMQTGLVYDVIESLEEHGVEYDVYEDVTTDIRYSTISGAAFVGESIDADCVIAVGGGSSLDCGKMVACALATEWLPMSVLNTWLIGPLFGHKPIISIPTTAGSGSEMAVTASVTCNDTHVKHMAGGPNLSSDIALLDVDTIKECPADIMAYCGIDALSHGLEAYLSGCASSHRQKADAARCVKLCMRYLNKAYSDPDDMEAKRNMLIAANCGGRSLNWCFGGYNQAFAYALGMTYYVHHGKAVAMAMTANLKWLQKIRENELGNLALYCNVGDMDRTASQNAEAFIEAVDGLIDSLGLSTYADMIQPEDYGVIIDNAFNDSINYPLPKAMTKDEAVEFLNTCSGRDIKTEDVKTGVDPFARIKPNGDNRDLMLMGASVIVGLGIAAVTVHKIIRSTRKK